MDKRTQLIKIIQDSVQGCATYWAGLIADGLLASGISLPDWTPESAKPEVQKVVYGCAKHDFSLDYHGMEVIWDGLQWRDRYGRAVQVSHWMPLPQLPAIPTERE